MKIHEVTRKQQVNEILGLAGALIGGVAKQAAKQFTQKFNPIGYDAAQQSASGTDRIGGMKITQSIADELTKQMQKAWAQTVQSFLLNAKDAAGNPATSLADVTGTSKEGLRNELVQMINKMISPNSTSFTYTSLPRMVGDDPAAKQAAQEMITAINTNMDKIFDATVTGGGANVVQQAFKDLVGNGIAPAQNAIAYDRSANVSSQPRFAQDTSGRTLISVEGGPWELFVPASNPKHKEIADKMAAGTL